MKHELMPDRISYTEKELLAPGEIVLMKDKILKQLIIYVPGYLVLSAIGINFYLRGPGILNQRPSLTLHSVEMNEDTKSRFWEVAPYFCIFLFLLTTIFLVRYYFQSVHPFIKDIRRKEKLLIYYKPHKTEMALFRRYYISTPLYYNQQIEVSKADFESINEGNLLCLEIGPHSTYLLSLRNNGKKIHTSDLTL